MLQEQDGKEAEDEKKRISQASKRTSTRDLGTKAAKKPPQPRKNTKKTKNAESDNSPMETGKPLVVIQKYFCIISQYPYI